MKKMQIKIKGFPLVLVFSLIQNFSLAQSSSNKIDSVTLTISYDSIKHELRTIFTNQRFSSLSLPWQEQLPYVDFDNDTVMFTIYLGKEHENYLLRIQKNIPTFTFENNPIELKSKGMICKVIELDDMISKNELNNVEIQTIFAVYTVLRYENSTFKKYTVKSNSIILH